MWSLVDDMRTQWMDMPQLHPLPIMYKTSINRLRIVAKELHESITNAKAELEK